MSMMHDFDKDFVVRTKELLSGDIQRKSVEYDVTLQLNCLLSMVVLPLERKRNDNDTVDIAFKKSCIDFLRQNATITLGAQKTDDYLMMDIRDAIAHLRIQVDPDPYGEIQDVIIENKYNKKYEFSCRMSVKTLKDFALHVTNEYLRLYF